MDHPFEETFIHTNGIRLHVVQSGPVDGPLVVLLHGFPEFWYAWAKQIGPLAEAAYRVVVPDQRGYNLSDRPKEVDAYRIEELGWDVLGLLDSLGRRDCCLAGHDWGAGVAWYLALTCPQLVSKLVILNVPHPAVMRDYIRSYPHQMRMSWYIAFFQIPGLADWLVSRNHFKSGAASMVRSSRPGTFSETDLAAYRQAWSNSHGLTGMINWYRALVRYRPAMPKDIRAHIPVRILWGKQDAFLSHAMAAASAEYCDRVEMTLYEQATHWVQHEEAAAVTAEMMSFLNSSI